MIKGKRFLITQPMIHGINGSVTVTLELADYLQSEGAEVIVYTHYYDEPAKSFFEEKSIKVILSQDDPEFFLSDFDYIWVHSQVLPVSVVRALADNLPEILPKIIFHHMSPLESVPDERPYIFDLENRISSKTLFISSATQRELKDYFTKKLDFGLFRNPAPKIFSDLKYKPRKKLKRILIVSNHPPLELLEAKDLLKAEDLEVVSVGETSEDYSLITPDLLSRFDMVVTIGKTVQYCLVAGIPVYIYDHFGGNGYLTEDSYDAAAARNFSGRDGEQQTANFLKNDIIEGYTKAVVYQTRNKNAFIEELSVEKVLPKVLENVKTRAIEQFDVPYMNAVISAQIFSRNRFESGARDWNNAKLSGSLSNEVNRLQATVNGLTGTLDDLQGRIDDLSRSLEFERDQRTLIMQSKSYKLGSVAAKPYRLTKKIIKRHRGEDV